MFTLEQLAAMSDGQLLGNPSEKITGAASLTEANAGEVTFLGNRRYLPLLRKSRASAAFVPRDFRRRNCAGSDSRG